MLRIRRGSSGAPGDRRLLIGIDRRGLGLLVRGDGGLVRLVGLVLIAMLDGDLGRRSS
jgi:hypothetical protein